MGVVRIGEGSQDRRNRQDRWKQSGKKSAIRMEQSGEMEAVKTGASSQPPGQMEMVRIPKMVEVRTDWLVRIGGSS
jgi:hypothetical protein